jgi:hypothetical protein
MNQSGQLKRIALLLTTLLGSTLVACGGVEMEDPSQQKTAQAAREFMARQGGDEATSQMYPEPTGYCGDYMCSIDEQGWCPEDCGYSSYCGDGYCDSYYGEDCSTCEYDCGPCYNPDVVNVPGTPQKAPIGDLYAKSQYLGVSPMVAGVPNIDTYLQNQYAFNSFTYPSGATGVQDFVNKLFQSGIWANSGPTQTVTPLAPDANGCQLRRVDAAYNPEELVNFDAGAGLLYPSAINQGQYINLGVGSLTPIHVPYPQRKPVNLVATFFQSSTAPTGTSTDVYGSIGQMIQSAQAQGGITQSTVYFDMQSASTLEEAAVKFKLDAKVLGGNINATFSSLNTTQSNTVFVRFTQSLFTVFQDMGGYTPAAGQFNSSFGVSDLENLGNMGELGYDNLPTYVRAVTYGRMLIFSVTSTSSKEDLQAAVNAVYGSTSASASADQKKVINESTLRVFGYGGPAEPQVATIKSGNWQDYFTLVNVPLVTLKPVGYEVRRWDDQFATMSRTTSYTERTCPGVKKIRVELSDSYKETRAYVRKTGSTTFDEVLYSTGYASGEINQHLLGSDDELKVTMTVGKPGFFSSYQGRVRLKVFVDNVLKFEDYYSCTTCHSKDPVWVLNVNQYTGDVIRRY